MKSFFKPCGRYRQSICLLASGDLAERERIEAQNHLASCADCRQYFDELKALTVTLATWERSLAHIQPDSSLQLRWARAVRALDQRGPKRSSSAGMGIQGFWHELFLPVRWHLAGMGALWMITAILNTEPSSTPAITAQNKTSPRELLMALRENRRQVAELINPPANEPAPPPEVFVPRRRSEVQLRTAVA